MESGIFKQQGIAHSRTGIIATSSYPKRADSIAFNTSLLAWSMSRTHAKANRPFSARRRMASPRWVTMRSVLSRG